MVFVFGTFLFILMLDVCMFLTGYGGGFNEREDLEYKEREESDGEYDEVRLHVIQFSVLELINMNWNQIDA